MNSARTGKLVRPYQGNNLDLTGKEFRLSEIGIYRYAIPIFPIVRPDSGNCASCPHRFGLWLPLGLWGFQAGAKAEGGDRKKGMTGVST